MSPCCSVADLTVGLDETDPDSPIRRYTAEHLRVRGAADLLTAYVALPPSTRSAVLNLLVEAVRAHKAGDSPTAVSPSKAKPSHQGVLVSDALS